MFLDDGQNLIHILILHFTFTFVADSGRVRIAVRVRPMSAEEVRSDADFPDCVELQPEVCRN